METSCQILEGCKEKKKEQNSMRPLSHKLKSRRPHIQSASTCSSCFWGWEHKPDNSGYGQALCSLELDLCNQEDYFILSKQSHTIAEEMVCLEACVLKSCVSSIAFHRSIVLSLPFVFKRGVK